jgi:hypothetical protein
MILLHLALGVSLPAVYTLPLLDYCCRRVPNFPIRAIGDTLAKQELDLALAPLARLVVELP